MRKAIVFLAVAGVVFFIGLACGGGEKKEKGKFTEIAVEEPTEVTETETVTETIPAAPVYEPTKNDVLVQLDDVLGASEDTLGWDNVFCSISLDKSLSLLDVLRPTFKAGSTDLGKCDSAINDLGNIKTTLDNTYILEGKGLDPKGTDAKNYKKTIRTYREWVRGLLYPTAPKEPIPEWKGDLMKEKWHERGELMKKKWAERGK